MMCHLTVWYNTVVLGKERKGHPSLVDSTYSSRTLPDAANIVAFNTHLPTFMSRRYYLLWYHILGHQTSHFAAA